MHFCDDIMEVVNSTFLVMFTMNGDCVIQSMVLSNSCSCSVLILKSPSVVGILMS